MSDRDSSPNNRLSAPQSESNNSNTISSAKSDTCLIERLRYNQANLDDCNIVESSGQKCTSALDVSTSTGDDDELLNLGFDEQNAAQTIKQLRQDLENAQKELRLKNETFKHLQKGADEEIHELTEQVFQEAYKMAAEAEKKRIRAEKSLAEATMRIDMMQAELSVLKPMVEKSSTPTTLLSGLMSAATPSSSKKTPFALERFGSPLQVTPSRTSRFQFPRRPTARVNGSSTSSSRSHSCTMCNANETQTRYLMQLEVNEIDPVLHAEFVSWRQTDQPLTNVEHDFLRRIYAEDIMPAMNFNNTELARLVLTAVEENTLAIEKFHERPQVGHCALVDLPRMCSYRIRINPQAEWFWVCDLVRNRVAAVCDFFTLLRYLRDGIIKCGLHEAYWKMVQLRKDIHLARLGFGYVAAAESE